jgi:4-hydroxymandelate oxidase
VIPILEDLLARFEAAVRPEIAAYVAAAASEGAVLASEQAWQEFRLRPHVLRDVSAVDTATTVLGERVRTPVLIAPMGFQQGVHPDGEVATASAAHEFGTIPVVSTRSTRRFEDVQAVCPRWWLQVYVLRDRGLTEHLVRRAVAHGAAALVLTADTPILGAQTSFAGVLDARRAHLTNLDVDPRSIGANATEQADDLTPDVVSWLRELSGLPVLVKGVLRADDARDCVRAGAAGIVVSNHGARQLARAATTARCLREVVDAVGDSAEVLVDGGVRDGSSVLAALACGARAVLVGRPVLWGLGAAGADGVTAVLAALTRDLRAQLALSGHRSPDDVDASVLD